MSTRGFITFAVNGQLKTAYNHSDSYPFGLGIDLLKWLRETDHAQIREQAAALRVIDRDAKPTAEDIEHLKPWTDLGVSTRSTDDWYCLLRDTQGDPAAMLAAGIIEDASGFPADSLFAEWGYVIDLDGDGLFEVYEGFQKSPHQRGRFASLTPDPPGYPGAEQYYPVALKARWPLAALPTEDEFMAAADPKDEDA